VVDAGTGAPLERFFVHRAGALVEERVSLGGPPRLASEPGPLELVLTAPGYAPLRQALRIEPGINRLQAALTAAPSGTLAGVVRQTPPVGPFRVQLDGVTRVFDDPRGTFRLEARTGQQLASFGRGVETGPFERQQTIEIRPGETTWIEVELARPGRVEGLVVDAFDRPIAQAQLAAGDSLGVSDREGRFALGMLPPGPVSITVRHPDFHELTETVRVEEDHTTTCRLVVAPPVAR
jgi:Carboxypeptidase regulatory-like domain